MLKLNYDPSVLKALEQSFKPNIATRQLDRYLQLLQSVMRMSLIGRSRFAQLKNLYEFPIKKLWNGPQIGLERIRVHKWLNDNNLALIKNINPAANNISHESSIVKPTSLLIITDADDFERLRKMSGIELDYYLDTLTDEWRMDVEVLQDDYVRASSQVKSNDYDPAPIDIESLKKFIKSMILRQHGFNRVQEEKSFYQALYILRIAQVNNGVLYQKREKKPFGRTYYEGNFSVQAVNKKLRAAMLGDSWEYDCKSCSTSWKMAFADEWHLQASRRNQSVRQKFSAMTMYLERKEYFFSQVINSVFVNDPQRPHNEKKDIVKQAMTALGFGAKLGLGRWRNDGKDQITSLYEVFDKDIELLKLFVTCPIVKKFNTEQQTLNKYILNKFSVDKKLHQDMAVAEKLKGKSFNKSQMIVWLFQHAETIMMDMVRAELKTLKINVLANIHDAIVTRERIPKSELQKIENFVREKTSVGYFALNETPYQACQ